jgi:hypothetical protein
MDTAEGEEPAEEDATDASQNSVVVVEAPRRPPELVPMMPTAMPAAVIAARPNTWIRPGGGWIR